ncbi:MAG: hypothetical protein AB7T59_02905 [Hyphomonadaceae bacterium]
MTKTKPHQQGSKTVEQRKRTLEHKPDLPREDADGEIAADDARVSPSMDRNKRQSEFPVSRGGMNQESHHHKSRGNR